jgi:hypothetical protein
VNDGRPVFVPVIAHEHGDVEVAVLLVVAAGAGAEGDYALDAPGQGVAHARLEAPQEISVLVAEPGHGAQFTAQGRTAATFRERRRRRLA